jgi:hypothetical protein
MNEDVKKNRKRKKKKKKKIIKNRMREYKLRNMIDNERYYD